MNVIINKTVDQLPTQFLRSIYEKVSNGKRITREEGIQLFKEDIVSVCWLADQYRKKRVGDIVYFSNTLFIHPTNLCELSCPMCSFYAKPGWDTAWFKEPCEIIDLIKNKLDKQINEVHFVGGLWRDANLAYYKECFTAIKELDPNIHIKALTPVEYDFLARLDSISIEEVFERMISWGLESLPGGGAEILNDTIRKKVAPGKITTDQYLAIHKLAHKKGIKSNITMLFNHIESEADIVDHCITVRDVQDETNGFNCFVPLKYHVENNALGKRTARHNIKNIPMVYAISRLLLDNVRNIKVLWNYLGVENALHILNCGANDLASTAMEERIIRLAGGTSVSMNESDITQVITKINRKPLKVHSGHLYDE